MLQNFHVLQVTYIGATDHKPSRVRISSFRFKQSKTIEYDHNFNNTGDIAEDWLTKNGFELIGKAESKEGYAMISTTFKPFREV